MIPSHVEQKVQEFIECNRDLEVVVLDGSEFPELGAGLLVRSGNWETETHIGWDALEKHPMAVLRAQCAQGKDVKQMTRVTGYFSYVGQWNKGKSRELKDRYRSRGL